MSARATLKACFEAGLVRSGVPALNRAARARRGLVLAYHNVVPDSSPGFGDRSLHLPRGLFMRQLESLLATHTVVPLEQVLDAPVAGRRPRAAITFDDGYRGAVLLGVAELAKRGVPATLFVVPSFVGKGPFWWDALAAERDKSGRCPRLFSLSLDEAMKKTLSGNITVFTIDLIGSIESGRTTTEEMQGHSIIAVAVGAGPRACPGGLPQT